MSIETIAHDAAQAALVAIDESTRSFVGEGRRQRFLDRMQAIVESAVEIGIRFDREERASTNIITAN